MIGDNLNYVICANAKVNVIGHESQKTLDISSSRFFSPNAFSVMSIVDSAMLLPPYISNIFLELLHIHEPRQG